MPRTRWRGSIRPVPKVPPTTKIPSTPPVPSVPDVPDDPPLPNDTAPLRENPGSPDVMSLGPGAYLVSTHAIGVEMGMTRHEVLVFINGLNARLLTLEPDWTHPAIPLTYLGDRIVVDHLALTKGWCRVFNPNMSDAERIDLAKCMVSTTNENIRYNLYRIAKYMYPALVDRIRRVSKINCKRFIAIDSVPAKPDNLRSPKGKPFVQIEDTYAADYKHTGRNPYPNQERFTNTAQGQESSQG